MHLSVGGCGMMVREYTILERLTRPRVAIAWACTRTKGGMTKDEKLGLTAPRGCAGSLRSGFLSAAARGGMPRAASGPTSRFSGEAHRVCLLVAGMMMKIVSLRFELANPD